ncbi:hypothetical protein OIV83_004348 [Microbotryomycetes sp. JL201]|nr:hypothetical protein OIV83_004277 [Microbotryomycetes sp. JL201]KAK4049199.1 hypothetical protein OIV83_004348 [Microbotryomycetes sp. JL201]
MAAAEDVVDDVTLLDLKVDTNWKETGEIVSFVGQAPPAPFVSSDLKGLNELARVLLSASNPDVVFPPVPRPQPNERSTRINAAKEQGNKAFRQGHFQDAIKLYTLSCDLAASRPVFEASVYAQDELALSLSNRSAAYAGAGEWINALVDADAVIEIKKTWIKGYFRKGKALIGLGRLEEAREAYLLGLQFDPTAEASLAGKRRQKKRYFALGGRWLELTFFLFDLIAATRDVERQLLERQQAPPLPEKA